MLFFVILWIYLFVWSIVLVLGWLNYKEEGVGISCLIDWKLRDVSDLMYGIVLIIVCFVLFGVVIVYCYFNVYKVI